MKHFFIGRSPLTSIAGYILAILLGIHEAGLTGSHQWQDYLLPAAIALFGRLAGDDRRKPPTPPFSPVTTQVENVDEETTPVTFQRRGRQHKQQRNSNGRFGHAVAA